MSFLESLTTLAEPYGCDNMGKLRSAIVHTPGKELDLVNSSTFKKYLFDEPPDAARFRDEHLRYQALLKSHGVKVLELSDYVHRHKDVIERLPNTTYVHDTAAVSGKGAILSSMDALIRKGENAVVREAFENLGIPVLIEFDDPCDAFEGCALLSADSVLVFCTDRFKFASVYKFIRMALEHFSEVIFCNVPKGKGYSHPDTVFNRINASLALAYLPAIRETYLFRRGSVRKIDFSKHMKRMGIELVGVSQREQKRDACSFLALDNDVIVHDEKALDSYTRRYVSRKGIDFVFHNSRYLKAGGGSIRSLTLRLCRNNNVACPCD